MSTVSRRDRVKARKAEMNERRFSHFAISVSIIFLAITLGLCAVIYVKYNSTEKWADSRLNGAEANIPPEFAKNTYSAAMLKDVDSLSSVTKVLNDVSRDGGLTADTIKPARKALARSQAILKAYHITGGESMTNQNNLLLDIRVYDVEKSAYSNPDSAALSSVINDVTKRNLSNETKTDQQILARLNNIANDYKALNSFVDTYVPKLGNIDGNLITVKKSVSAETTYDILAATRRHNLSKFPNINKLRTLLESVKWQKVMANNESVSENEKWSSVLAVFHALSQSEYIDSDSIQTLADAKKINAAIDGAVQRDGYKILDASSVISITVDGMPVTKGQYIRKDAKIAVTILPSYERSNKNSSSRTPSSSSIKSSSSSSSDPSIGSSSNNSRSRRSSSQISQSSSSPSHSQSSNSQSSSLQSSDSQSSSLQSSSSQYSSSGSGDDRDDDANMQEYRVK